MSYEHLVYGMKRVVPAMSGVLVNVAWEFFTFEDMWGKTPNAQLAMLEMNLAGRAMEMWSK